MLVVVLASALVAATAQGQYFGQNKVRYETFDFKILKTPHFDIYYYDEQKEAIDVVALMAERWYERLSRALNHDLPPNQPLIFYDSHPAFRSTTVLPGFIGDTTGGVTEGLRRRIIMPLAGPLADTDHVLGHELVHAFQYDITTRRSGAGMGVPGVARLPLWFVEGMAEYLSVGPVDTQTTMWLRDAVKRDEIPSIKDLNDPRFFPYRWGHAVWAYIAGRFGDQAVSEMLRSAGSSGSPDAAMRSVLGVTIEALSEAFQSTLREEYEPVLAATTSVEEQAQPIRRSADRRRGLYVGPTVSPDGRYVAFYSEIDLFSIDLYLAEVESGKIIEKLTRTDIDPHFDSLAFVSSAGAWSPDGERLAFVAVGKGRPELHIYDVTRSRPLEKIRFPEFGEIFNPNWSSDGRTVAFTAIQGGVLDLFVYDLETGEQRRLTNDLFAEMQASFSPDGRTLVITTDRFTSDPSVHEYGGTRLALVDVQSGQMRPLEAFPSGKHINPHFSADGRHIYFVSDQNGISNVYRIPVSGGTPTQITNVDVGVSGIAATSPALSTASKVNSIAFSTFEAGGYSIYGISDEQRLAGVAPPPLPAGRLAGVLPPRERMTSTVAAGLQDATGGLPTERDFEQEPYKAKLKLDYFAQPSVGVGISNFGGMVGGGTAFYFSDMLRQHSLMTSIQTVDTTGRGNILNSISAVAGYENSKHRWTWGAMGGQVPYVFSRFGQGVTEIDGQPVLLEDHTLVWQIERVARGMAAYPFNRAQRIEFLGGYRRIGFDVDQRINVFDPFTGQFLGRLPEQDTATPNAMNMGSFSTALVYDTSIFGGVSPVRGQRYRIELGGVAGALSFTEGLLDYRKYYQPWRALTLAGRVLHFGRYGGSAEDPRQQPLFLGYPNFIRGYKPGSFSAQECGPALAETGQCPVFDRLIGSRIGTANVEARIPLMGALGAWRTPSLPPVEAAFFFDGGIAWTSAQTPTFFNGSRKPVSSYGVSLRANVLGFAIAQFSYVRPNNRPLQNWMWEFALIPGF
jgi:hypothetical protein